MEQEFAPGDLIFDRYSVEGIIGSGGMATVFKCRDLRLDLDVAVKILRRQFRRKPDIVQRFLREAKLQAKLRHPNIVQVTNVEDHDGLTLMVMEFLKGMALDAYVRAKNGLSEKETLELIIPVSDALAVAHDSDIVHRDVKPSNIFLAEEGRRLVAKLMDFGVARELDASITTSSTLLGTLPYMSFELVQSARNASPASDVYAIGVSMFEMIAGRHPIEAHNLQEYVFSLMGTESAPRLSTIRPDVSPELDDVIVRCLSKEPQNRYQNARELVRALEALPPDRAMAEAQGASATSAQSHAVELSNTMAGTLGQHYTVDRALGSGPNGQVYLCRSTAGDEMAVKTLRTDRSQRADLRQAFVHAARSQQQVAEQSPFVQPIKIIHEELPAIACVRPAGNTLDGMLQSYGRFDSAYTIELFILLVDGLRIAHRNGLLHQHVHPGNIYLAQHSDGVVTPQLMDFGHCQISERNLDSLANTFYYVAPELNYNLSIAAPTADIYGLGMCLYRTVTGRLPLEAGPADTWLQQVGSVGTFADPRSWVPEIPEGLAQVVGWCISPAPGERYQSADEVHRDLVAVKNMLPGY